MAAALSFDDLIPAQQAAPAAGGALSFNDLVPQGDALPWQRPGYQAPTAPAQRIVQAPTLADYGQRADDIARGAANGLTLGFADKLAGAVNGDGAGAERAKSAAAVQRTGPLPALVGAALPTGAAAGSVGALGDLFGVASPVLRGAATGAGVGAASAAGHDEPIATGAAAGAAVGGAVPAAIGGASRLAGLFASPSTMVPTSAELAGNARQAYQEAEQAGVVYSPQAMSRLQGDVQNSMAQFGYAPELQPGGAAVLRSLDRSDGTPTTLAGLDITRRIAGNMYSPTNPSSSALGGQIKGVIDDFAANPQPGDVMMGDGPGGVSALQQARQLYQRSSKDQDLSDALDTAGLRAGSTGSGGNINNATRQLVRQAYQGRQDWTPDEDAALRSIITGTPVSNTLRQAGKLSPEGNGLMQAMHLGAAMTSGGATVPVSLGGFFAKRAADAMTARAVDRAGQLIRVGGDASSLLPTPTGPQMFLQGAGDPVLQAVLAGRSGQER